MADKVPVAYHTFLKDGVGNPIAFFRMTAERCPSCSPATKDARIGITHESNDHRSETAQCTHCDYILTRPYRDPPGRRMNAGREG